MFKSCRPDHYTITDCGFLPAIFLFLYTVLAIMISSRVRICACNGLADRKRGAPLEFARATVWQTVREGRPHEFAPVTVWQTVREGRPHEFAPVTVWQTVREGRPLEFAPVTVWQTVREGRPHEFAGATVWQTVRGWPHSRIGYLNVRLRVHNQASRCPWRFSRHDSHRFGGFHPRMRNLSCSSTVHSNLLPHSQHFRRSLPRGSMRGSPGV